MGRMTLFLFAALAVTSVDAAWYQKTDGTIVDPIQSLLGGDHSYSGNNLQPNEYLSYADLTGADLASADLRGVDLWYTRLDGADLTSADLRGADLWETHLDGADLTSADLRGVDVWDAYLMGADLSGSQLSGVMFYNNATWTDAFYYTDNEPTWDSGMNAAWRSSVGILALAPVPEPAAILLALLGLALLPQRRRR